METASQTGRIIGVLIIINMIGSGMVNFVMERPLAGGEFLLNAAPNSRQIGVAVVLGLVTEGLWVAIAITAFPMLFARTQRMAIWIVALAVVSLAVAVVENIGVMSMVSLSQAYSTANTAEREQIQALGLVVTAARNWPHFISRLFVGITTFVFYSVLYRFRLVPRVLAAFGLVAALLMVTSVAMPLFGQSVIFPMLAPMGICQLALALWLILRGFRLQFTAGLEPLVTK